VRKRMTTRMAKANTPVMITVLSTI
jgi:hypothetical protein